MILKGILNVLGAFISLLLSPINFPSLPSGIATALQYQEFTNGLASGISVIAAYTHFTFLSTLFLSIMAMHAIEILYKWVCWVLRKIPILNVRG